MAIPLTLRLPAVASPIFCPAWAIEWIEYPEKAAINDSIALIYPSTPSFANVGDL
jgi:hypothetical protein